MTDSELPADLAERAAEQLLAAPGEARDEVLRGLVAAHPAHGDALRRLAADLLGVDRLLATTYHGGGDAPAQIGAYRVLRRLGEGAFGVVWLCTQQRPVTRRVAVKVLRPGAGDPRTLQRFASERQLLATLNHPGITQVFDAGELADGRPFFVMEYVDGAPLHTWCSATGATCALRLRLFADVCRAVAHAHARGIVHRDLKPANVLVVATDEGPMPKVIDFGIAKALDPTGDGEPRTEAGRVIGTPGYMSPEQAAGRTNEVDARADVFALGVMLYELLTGSLPWPHGASASDTGPVRPSARVASTTTDCGASGAPRHRLAAALRGDLDWITLKALAHERGDRYATAAGLAADIERHLRGETVLAGPPALGYRLRKFVRRNRTAVATASAGLALALGVAVALTYSAGRAEAASLADARGFVARLLERARDPALFGSTEGDAVRKALCAEAVAFTDRLLLSRADDPGLQFDRCEALLAISEVHTLLGEFPSARAAAVEAMRLAAGLRAANPSSIRYRGLLGSAMEHEARVLAMAGDRASAAARFAAAIEHLGACAAQEPGVWDLSYAKATCELAATCPPAQRQHAIDLYRDALQRFDAHRRDATREDFVSAGIGLARLLFDEGRHEDAQHELDRVAPDLAALGPLRLRYEWDFHSLSGDVLSARGDRKRARGEHEAAAAAADAYCAQQPRRVHAHRVRIAAQDQLARVLNYLDDFEGSSAAFRRAIAAAEAMIVQFPDDPTARVSLCTRLCRFAYTLYDRFRQRDLAEAEALVERALDLDARLGDAAIVGRVPRWQLLATRAMILESRGDPRARDAWRQVEALLPGEGISASNDVRAAQLEASLGIVHMLVADRDAAAAAPRLAAARAVAETGLVQKKVLVQVGWLEAQLAVQARDHAAAAAAAERIVAARPTWLGFRRAGDCLRLAANCTDEPDVALDYRTRAAEWYEKAVAELDGDVAKHPDDPWFVLPWGFAKLGLADLAVARGDTAAARELLAAALPRLAAVRDEAVRDEWDDDAFARGDALRAQLGAGGDRH
jgi:tetratricopeptide (TPR) repeat protein/predicted Ser/Thr protein kinase